MMTKPILFISDLHLQPSRPDITALFSNFLTTQASQAQALYILGDLFEVWIGDDDHCELQRRVIDDLFTLHQNGVALYFMHGNRDFLIGSRFAKQSGCQLLADPCKIDLFGTPTLLMHGDTLCTQDINYQKFRKRVRKPIVQKVFLALPLALRKRIAGRVRDGSTAHTHRTAAPLMDVNPKDVIEAMQDYDVLQLIHGHTHRPNVHALHINLQPAKRFVLGAWHDNGSVLHCEDGKTPELVTLS